MRTYHSVLTLVSIVCVISILFPATSIGKSKCKKGAPMAQNDSLEKYHKRRKFAATPEPRGKVKRKKGKKPIFVIQKHDASHLHYDVRLEIDGVLKSWAVPKGPSTNPRDKRLAMPTEDHPMEYAKFEGSIPEGNYGAGTVMVWDIGTYENLKEKDGISMSQCYENGQIEVEFHGKKLHGGYALIRLKTAPVRWILLKMRDEYADAHKKIVTSEPDSALTGRSLKEIAKETSDE